MLQTDCIHRSVHTVQTYGVAGFTSRNTPQNCRYSGIFNRLHIMPYPHPSRKEQHNAIDICTSKGFKCFK